MVGKRVQLPCEMFWYKPTFQSAVQREEKQSWTAAIESESSSFCQNLAWILIYCFQVKNGLLNRAGLLKQGHNLFPPLLNHQTQSQISDSKISTPSWSRIWIWIDICSRCEAFYFSFPCPCFCKSALQNSPNNQVRFVENLKFGGSNWH